MQTAAGLFDLMLTLSPPLRGLDGACLSVPGVKPPRHRHHHHHNHNQTQNQQHTRRRGRARGGSEEAEEDGESLLAAVLFSKAAPIRTACRPHFVDLSLCGIAECEETRRLLNVSQRRTNQTSETNIHHLNRIPFHLPVAPFAFVTYNEHLTNNTHHPN